MNVVLQRLVGAVLAGGESRRMGSTKAALEWADGETMAARAVRALRHLTEEVVVLGHGEGVDAGLTRLPDSRPNSGPLAGIESIFLQLRCDESIVVTCDMPLVDGPLLARLPTPPPAGVSLFDDASGDTEPFPMRLHAGVLPALTTWLDSGRRDVRGFVASLPQNRARLAADERELLVNVNRANDVQIAAGIAKRRGQRAPLVETDTAISAQVNRAQVVQRSVLGVREGVAAQRQDVLAVEEPLEIRVASVSIAVVMRTPGHDEELSLGFLISEGIIASADQLRSIRHCTETSGEDADGNVMLASPVPGLAIDLDAMRRNLFVGSSCGVCGKATIEAAMQRGLHAPMPGPAEPWNAADLVELPERMRASQHGFGATGAVHAAALFDATGKLLVVREDVGRHNAVDKVIGWCATREVDTSNCALAVSGRVSFEIVQKAWACGVPMIVAVSAPTSLALQMAEEAGITVIGFVRGKRMNIYTLPEQVTV